jgi:hypothetical protein
LEPLPFVQIDRDAERRCSQLAGLMGVSPQHALGGYVSLLFHVANPARLEALVLAGSDDVRLPAAELEPLVRLSFGRQVELGLLADAGLLAAPLAGRWLVVGCERYLPTIRRRLHARSVASAGGRARAAKAATKQPEPSQQPANDPANSQPTTEPAASQEPASEPAKRLEVRGKKVDPTTTTLRASARGKAEKEPPDPRHSPMVKRLVEAYEEMRNAPYAFTGKDAKVVQRLLAMCKDDNEIEVRWRVALTRQYGGVADLALFAARFNDYAPKQQAQQGRPALSIAPPPQEPRRDQAPARRCPVRGCENRIGDGDILGIRVCEACETEELKTRPADRQGAIAHAEMWVAERVGVP